MSKSQLDSVKKQMKLQLIAILKHPQCGQHSKIIDILIDLGMSQSEVINSFNQLSYLNNQTCFIRSSS